MTTGAGERPQQPALARLIVEEADRRDINLKEACEREIGMKMGYFIALRHRHRDFEKISRKYLDGIAKFLGLPVVTTMRLAGVIREEDFLAPTEAERERDLELALQMIKSDPEYGTQLTNWDALDEQTARFVVHCYERATGKKLITKA